MNEFIWPPEIRTMLIGALMLIVPALAALGKAKLDALRAEVEAGHNRNATAIAELQEERSTPDDETTNGNGRSRQSVA